MRNRTPAKLPVPAFTPVPRKKPRYDGWTAERQVAFLDALAETGSVKHAAMRINMAAEGAYALRRQPGAESFCMAWDAALNHGVQRLTGLAIDRAIEGVEVPVYSYGKLIGTRRVVNDRLLMFCLKHNIGRIGGEDPNPLRPGTRSAETVARDATAEKARWIEEEHEALARFAGTLAAQLVDMGKTLRWALVREHHARRSGLFEGERTFARMADKVLALLEKPPEHWAQDYDATRKLYDEMSACDEAREYCFTISPAKPPDPGPTSHARRMARDDALRMIEQGQAMWRAAGDEAGWADWKARAARR